MNMNLQPAVGKKLVKNLKPIKLRPKKKEGNERLKNWEFLPKGLKLFYEDTPLRLVTFRTSSKGTRIEITKQDTDPTEDRYLWFADRYIWFFKFNKEEKRFGMHCEEEKLWIYSENEESIMY